MLVWVAGAFRLYSADSYFCRRFSCRRGGFFVSLYRVLNEKELTTLLSTYALSLIIIGLGTFFLQQTREQLILI